MNVREAIGAAAERLRNSQHLRADAHRDAAMLLQHLLGISRAQLLADPYRIVTAEQYASYVVLIQRRLAHEPIQYITGEQEFFALPFRVTPAVLIPRPETEHVVEAVLNDIHRSWRCRIVDVGTGSGAIAVALAKHLPRAEIIASDISPSALEVAAHNAARNCVGDRIRFVESDLLEGIALHAPFDVIVSNPPYIAFSEGKEMHPQVREFEPAIALFATGNGLDVYRRLIPQARLALKPDGLLALEIGHGQHDALAGLLTGWNDRRFIADLQQIPRVVLARKP
jgi:release factor glutamine methyltransferase